MNEVGADPARIYRLSFAGAASSGASFGLFQADCAANPQALSVLRSVLLAAKAPPDTVGRILSLLHVPCRTDPLTRADLALVDSALGSPQGRAGVDALDRATLEVVLSDLNSALDAAHTAGNAVDPAARIAICLWCNMAGRPTLLLDWLSGRSVREGQVIVEPPGHPISLADIERYLESTGFFSSHPQNWPHFAASVQAGVELLAKAA